MLEEAVEAASAAERLRASYDAGSGAGGDSEDEEEVAEAYREAMKSTERGGGLHQVWAEAAKGMAPALLGAAAQVGFFFLPLSDLERAFELFDSPSPSGMAFLRLSGDCCLPRLLYS